MKIKSELKCYEINGIETPALAKEALVVESHMIFNDRIILDVNGTKVTVIAKDLRRAIENATNHGL